MIIRHQSLFLIIIMILSYFILFSCLVTIFIFKPKYYSIFIKKFFN